MTLPEPLQCSHLGRSPLDFGSVASAYLAGDVFAVDQKLRGADAIGARSPGLLVVAKRLFELPFGAGHRNPPIRPAILALGGPLRKRRAQSRPKNHNNNIDRGGLLDAVLEVPGGKERLVLPQYWRKIEEPLKLAAQPPEHKRCPPSLFLHVARRRDQYAEPVGLVHGSALFLGRTIWTGSPQLSLFALL